MRQLWRSHTVVHCQSAKVYRHVCGNIRIYFCFYFTAVISTWAAFLHFWVPFVAQSCLRLLQQCLAPDLSSLCTWVWRKQMQTGSCSRSFQCWPTGVGTLIARGAFPSWVMIMFRKYTCQFWDPYVTLFLWIQPFRMGKHHTNTSHWELSKHTGCSCSLSASGSLFVACQAVSTLLSLAESSEILHLLPVERVKSLVT